MEENPPLLEWEVTAAYTEAARLLVSAESAADLSRRMRRLTSLQRQLVAEAITAIAEEARLDPP